MNHRNAGGDGASVTALVDRGAAAAVAARCGPRTRGLVEARDIVPVAAWLPRAAESIRERSPEVARRYEDLAAIVKVAPSAAHGSDLSGAA